MSDSYENVICIMDNGKNLSVKFRDITDLDYIENIVTEVSDRVMEKLTSSRTPIEQIDDILNGIKRGHIC